MNNNVINLTAPVLQRPRLVPLLSPRHEVEAEQHVAKLTALRNAAAADHHVVLNPTHLMLKGDQLIGYLSLGGLPTVHAWFDTKHPHATDSLKMIETGEAIMASNGVRTFAVCVSKDSPFSPHMERLGFQRAGETVVWTKSL